MARVLVRLNDDAGNPYDFFIGEAADCPPLPRIGEYVDYHLGVGKVTKIAHIYEDVSKVAIYRIAITLEMLK